MNAVKKLSLWALMSLSVATTSLGITIPETYDRSRMAEWALYYVQDHIEVPSPAFHGEVYDKLEEGPLRLVIRAFRGSAKSSIARTYILKCIYDGDTVARWIGLKTPTVQKIMFISSSLDVAVESLEFIKNQIDDNLGLRDDYPNYTIMVWNQRMIRIRRPDGSIVEVRARGAGAKIRGFRPDILIIDDVEDDEGVVSEDQRAKLLNWLNSACINTLKPWQQLIVMGTNLHPLSLINTVSSRKGYEVMRFIVRQPDGASAWPEYWTEDMIRAKEDEIGKKAFLSEYMDAPIVGEFTIFEPHWFKHYDEKSAMFENHLSKGLRTVIAIDPAISRSESADYTAIVTLSSTFDRPTEHFARKGGVIRGRWPINKQVSEIVRLYEKFNASAVLVETVAYQQALADEIKRWAEENRRNITVKELKRDADKERRAHAITGEAERGRIFFEETDPMQDIMLSELMMFPHGARDDLVDAVVDATTDNMIWGGRKESQSGRVLPRGSKQSKRSGVAL